MAGAFWKDTNELDPSQRAIVSGMEEDASFLLKGPAGSGKTNILLLRAKWLTLKNKTNFHIVVFTRSLRDFIVEGCEQYGIDPNSVVTQITFFKRVLDEHGVKFELSNDFDTDRSLVASKVKALLDSGRVSDNYATALLIDEAQDYTDTELLSLRGLTKRLMLAADSRQSIYKSTHSSGLLEKLVGDRTIELTHHYRSGLKLCKVADAILSDSLAYPRVQDACGYKESEMPSSVKWRSAPSFELQVEEIESVLEEQVGLYPDEQIGILFPRRDQVETFRRLARSTITALGARIWIDTLHGSKGREFRAVHVGGCEALPKMGAAQKRLIYTGVLRGKTSAHIYFTGRLPGYLHAALATLQPPPADPALEDLLSKC